MLLNCGVGDSWKARSNLSILKEISPEYSLEEPMLKLKLQYFGHLMGRTDSFEKTLMLERLKVEGEGDDRGWSGWMASLTRWTWIWVSSGSWWWIGKPGVLQSMGLQRVRHDWATELTEWLNYSLNSSVPGLPASKIIVKFFYFFPLPLQRSHFLIPPLPIKPLVGLFLPLSPFFLLHQPEEGKQWKKLLPCSTEGCWAKDEGC